MSFLTTLATLGIRDLVLSVLDRAKVPAEERAKIELALTQNKAEVEKFELELSRAEALSASRAIRVEATTGDAYTRRARPTFLYIVYIILVWNYILLPSIQFAGGAPPQPIELPEPLFWLFGAGYLGYVGARSWDKRILSKQ